VSGLLNHLNQQKKEQAHCDLARRRSKKVGTTPAPGSPVSGARENQSIKRPNSAITAEVCNYHFTIFYTITGPTINSKSVPPVENTASILSI
jgi:hypothetical protein